MLQYQRSILFIGDVIALTVAFIAMTLIRFNIHTNRDFVIHQAVLFGWLFVIWLIIFFVFDLYNLRRVNPNPRNIGLLFASMLLNILLGVTVFYLFANSGVTPKTNLIIVAVLAFILLTAWRRLFYHLFSVSFTRTIATIGTSPLILDLQKELRGNPHFGEHIIHWDSIAQADTTRSVDIIIAEQPEPKLFLSLATTLQAEPLTLEESYETFFVKIPLSSLTDEKAVAIMTNNPDRGWHIFGRIIEVITASLILIIASPFLLIAILARLIEDGRPIFYTHKRVGKNGKLFDVYKIRSMSKDAEKDGARWAEKKDSRVTPVGQILRKTHIDEVPQMINIIKGDIALVGPRAERPEFVAQLEQEIPYYFLRHTIRPGFTGWAQIKYRYARTVDDAREKFEYDLYYLKNRTILLNIGIVLKTLQIIFTH